MMFRIQLHPDDNGTFLVTCPALPEVTTFGEEEADCRRRAVEAIEEALAGRIASGASIPAMDQSPNDPRGGDLFVVLPVLTELKVELYQALQLSGITRAELVRRLEWNRNSVDRLFRLDHASRLDQIEAAAGALGRVVRAEIVERETA